MLGLNKEAAATARSGSAADPVTRAAARYGRASTAACTAATPVLLDNRLLGVAGADLSVDSIERRLIGINTVAGGGGSTASGRS